jgi:opacity protein-like surface antigen
MTRLLMGDNSVETCRAGLPNGIFDGLGAKTALLGVAAIVAALTTPVHAADMAMPVKASAPPIVWDWNEAYFGVHIGYAQATTSWCTDLFAVNCNVAGAPKDITSQAPYGYAIGGQFGYRWQATPNFVLGASYYVDGMAVNMTSPSRTDPFGTRYSAFNNLQSITGEAGLSLGRSLFYGKGGWALTRVDFDAADTFTGADVSTPQWKWVQGWTAGGGYEFLLWTHLSIGVEYDYYKFNNIGNYTNILSNTGAVVGCAFCNFGKTSVQTVLARLNVKLWPWGP